ncbi:phage tail tape measure protein [Prevotella lacticifex]|uniref:Phage tail tape measure protein domain-containing protein n=1 Tax=Prevotella lacticifex TaxID=2854755 RepID=A0A9R1CAL1_9BACT|nr:phage tail tape measure protein [Prevotella lacticifex]GJG35821.1 hypothetical protein PRLR5003_09780 [Prevotella lacticifex]GJG39130.1 hypothetical protein PRLR5019_11010 [Prevotella lacticifex]GJG42190.1 hypothetical protein PRLR5025_09760 [Prevotella lacticifex]GJG45484.1 hypothetical protein PRLR5027_10790 [Prevotella lacticifex]GJG48541.1 hypothetical protein PRLR5052_09540 [Prevotella lacticifex]
MANQDTKVKIVDIQVKYQDAVNAMAKYRTAIDEAKNQLKALKQDLKDGKITQEEYNKQSEAAKVFMKQQTDSINTLNRQVQNQIRVTKEEEGSLKQLRAALSNATAQYDAMSRSERESAKGKELKNHIVEITTELKNAEQETLRFYRNVGNYPTSVTAAITGIRDRFAEIGRTITSMITGGGLLMFGQKILQVGRDFNDGMARVRAVTQGSAEDMAMMTEEAKRLGATTAYTASEAAGALENLTRNGLNAAQATNALAPTLQFAQANTIGLAEAADIMTNVSNGFNLGVAGMAQVSDSLSWTASHSATNVTQLAEALKNAAPFGAALGQPIEEVNASLGVLADVGIKGADAGSALRMVMLGLATSTAKQQAVFEKYGLEINQQTMKADGLTKTLEKLRDSGIMQSANSANELADIFGRRVSPQAMALLNNVDALQTKLAGLGEAQGTTGDMFEVSMSTVSQSVKGLESAWEAFLLSIYDSNSDALVGPLEALRSLVNWLREHLSEVGTLIMSVIGGISFAKLISGAMSAFTQIKDSAVTNAQAATQQVQVSLNNEIALRKQIASLTTQLESASAAERERIEVQLVAKKRELANQEKLTHKAKTQEITLWERAAALETGNGWTQAFAVAKMGVTGFVATAKTAFKGFIVTAILSLAFELLMKLFSKMKEGKGIFGTFASWCSSAWNAIVKGVVNAINYFIDLYNESLVVRGAVQMIALQFKNLWEGVKLIFNLIIDGVKSVGRALSGMGDIIKGIVTLSWDDIKAGFGKITSNFGATIKEAYGDLKNFGSAVGQNIVDGINNTISGAKIAHITIPKPETTPKMANAPADTGGGGTTPTIEDLQAQEDGGGTSGGSGGKGSHGGGNSAVSRADRQRAKAAEEEAKLVAEAEKAMLDLLGESIEKRRAMLDAQYSGEINKLKAKLETDKTLTEGSKDAIRQLITAKEMKLQDELSKLEDENLKKRIEEQQKLLDSRLALVRKGSEEELNIKLQQADEKLKIDLISLKQEEEAAQRGAATALMFRQAALDELMASGTATEEQLTKAREAVEYAQSEITRINEDYAERRLNMQEQHFMKEDELRRAHDQAVLDEQMLQLQNEIAQLEIANTEKMNKIVEGSDYEQTYQQSINELGLDVVTEFEMQKLQIQQEMAEQRLAFIMEQGQLETETEAQYNARIIAGKKAVADAKANFNQASLKNEQAYAKSMGGVTKSLSGLLDVLGEDNKEFAIMSKMITLFQITVDTGKALSAGIASASALPFPANMAAIATTVATVLANIATAISTVKSANFAEGGKVHGPGTGTSDSVPANLSNGEFVMTAKATDMFEPLLRVMNAIGAGVPINTTGAYERVENAESLTDSFTQAAQEIKPVVSVVEITETQERISMIENLDTL